MKISDVEIIANSWHLRCKNLFDYSSDEKNSIGKRDKAFCLSELMFKRTLKLIINIQKYKSSLINFESGGIVYSKNANYFEGEKIINKNDKRILEILNEIKK